MIDLPDFAVPGSFQATFNDAGFTQSGVQSDDYIARKGGRYTVAFMFGPYTPENARVMIARLIAGKQGGVRVKLPLLHDQGSPGTPLLNGAVTTGRTIEIDGLTPGYVIREGYWLSLVKSGQHFLHSVGVGATANGSGVAEIELNELLRDSFADNTVVNLAEPQVEGLLTGDEWGWGFDVNRVASIEFTLKEVR
jgi:hypothetical protein